MALGHTAHDRQADARSGVFLLRVQPLEHAEQLLRLRHVEARTVVAHENDLLIAATALAHDLTLVSHNVREFSRVANLKLEDWE